MEQLLFSRWLNRLAGFGSSGFRVDDVLVDSSFLHLRHLLVEHLESRPPRAVYLTHQHEDHAGSTSTATIIDKALSGGSRKDRVLAWLFQGDFTKANLVQAIIERQPEQPRASTKL